MSIKQAEWIFFDLGDTLVDNTRVWLRMLEDLHQTLSSMGRAYRLEELTSLFEQISAECMPHPFAELQQRIGLDEVEKKLAKENVTWRHDLEEVIPGTFDLLESIRDHYKLGIIANQAPGSEDRCNKWGLSPYFDVFLASAELGINKPNPKIFLLALKKAKCPPEKAVMVGDRIDNDIRPAKLLGMKTIRLVRGYQRFQEPRDEWDVADFTVYSLSELQNCLLENYR